MGDSNEKPPKRYTVTPDDRGRITIPVEAREQIHIHPHEELEMYVVDQQLVVEPGGDTDEIIEKIDQRKRQAAKNRTPSTPKSPASMDPHVHRHRENITEGAGEEDDDA